MGTMTYRQALNETLREELEHDENVILMGEEIGIFEGSYKVTAGLYQQFGARRIIDTPIAEEGFVGIAIGSAMLGLRPVVEIMTINFSLLAMDQLINHAAKIHYMFGGKVQVPMVLRTPGGGGQQLAATHSQNLEVMYAFVPGLKVVAPATPNDARGLLRSAIRDNDPVIFVENLSLYSTKGEVSNDPESMVPIGKADIKKEGTDITLIGYSRATISTLKIAQQLEEEYQISAEVLDLRSLRPLDRPAIIESVKKTNRALIVEDDWYSYGIGAEIAATIQEQAFDYLDAPVRRIASKEVPLPYAKNLERAAMPNDEDVLHAALAALEGTSKWR